MLLSTRTPGAISAHEEMRRAWEAYVAAHERFMAAAIAAHCALIPTEDEGLARAIAEMAYPPRRIGEG